jgi:tRNA dimethylallyltransferase
MTPTSNSELQTPNLPSVLAIVGPTGIGKSEAALEIARQVPSGAEIVVVDSMQVYRGMDLGTSKPSPSLRREIPHHGLDLADPSEDFDVARYVELVRPVISEIQRRGRLPILVAGCGLYLRALLDGLCPAPGRFPEIRQELLQEAEDKGTSFLHARLKKVDSDSAAKIHPNDLRKIVRALEVFQASGVPLSRWHRKTEPFVAPEELEIFGLSRDRSDLYRRIEERIDRWLDAGWLEEARGLMERPLSMTAKKALGYQELFRYLRGGIEWERCVSLIKQNTRRYAKRQWTWFRADPRVQWIDGTNPGSLRLLHRQPLSRLLAR